MPAGPSKFEGEGFATFALYDLSLLSGQDEDTGTTGYDGERYMLFRGSVEILDSTSADASAYGYTDAEIVDGTDELRVCVGAILTEDAQGFVYGQTFEDTDELERVWSGILDETETEDDEN